VIVVRSLVLATVLAAAAMLGLAVPAAAGVSQPAVTATPRTAVAGADLARADLVAADVLAGPRPVPTPSAPTPPSASGEESITVSVPGQPSRVVQLIVLITVIGVAPSLLLLCTAFTKIVVVLSLTRSAIGTQSVPPNQVLIGLALFLSLFVMGPVADAVQEKGIAPYMAGAKTATQAYKDGAGPLREFMLDHTRDEELALMTKAAGQKLPENRQSVGMRTLVPAFVISELRGAFIIGFVIFIPFLVVDIVVSAILMSLGMVMLPPALVSLPFKLLLFVLVDGWTLIVTTLLGTYR
jgi:flagellar biosynthetic protein FliP